MEKSGSKKRFLVIVPVISILVLLFGWFMYREYRLSRSYKLYKSASGYELANNYETAIKVLQEARGLNPGNPEISAKLASVYLRAGKTDAGIRILKETIAAHPAYSIAYYHLAFYYFKRKQYKTSKQYWQRFLDTNRDAMYDSIARKRLKEIDAFLSQE